MGDGVALGSAYGAIEIGTDQAEQNIQSLADTMRKAGTAMSLGVTAPLAGIATAAINSAADFEQSMNVMAQVTGATGDQMATLQAQALNLGAVTSFSAGEAADAMLELGKAGLSPVEIGDAIAGTMDLAAAGNLDLAQAATIAANAMNAFQLPASDVTNIANMLAAAANASSVDVTDLAQGMQMAGAVFASNGQSVEDLTTALAILGNNAITGSDAGTSLKTMLMRLASPTDDAAKAMNALGLEVFNADGSMRGFDDIVGNLQQATAGLTDEQRNAALTTIFGADAIRAATILAREGAEGFAEMSDSVNQQGAAAATANARMKGMRGAVEYLKGSIDSFLITAALPYLDALGGFVRMGADALSAFAAMPRPLMDAAVAFGAVLAAAGPVMLAIAGITAAIGFLLSPVGLLVAGVAAVAAGFVLWQQNFGNVQGRAAALAGMLKDMAENATGIDFDAIGEGVRSFGNYIGAVIEDGDYLNDWLTHLPESIQPAAEAFGRFVAALGALWNTGDIGAFVQELRDMFPEAAAAVDGAVGGVATAIGEISDAITAFREGNLDVPELIWNIANALTGGGADYYVIRDAVNAIGAAWQSVQGAALAMWAWLQVALPAAVEVMRSAWETAWQAVQASWDAVWPAIETAWTTAKTWLETTLPAALTILKTAWDGAWPAMQEAVGAAWQAIQPALTAAWAWLQVALPVALGWLRSVWEAAWPAMQAAWDAVWTPLSAAWTTVKTWLDTTLPTALTALKTAWDTGWPALQTVATTAIDAVNGAFNNLKSAFTSIQTGAGQVQGTLSGFLVQVTAIGAIVAAFFAPAVERLQTAFTALPEKLAPLMPKLQELGGAFMGLIQSLAPFVALIGVGLAIAADFGINALTAVLDNLPGLVGPIIDQVTATIRLISTVLTEVIAAVQAAINGDWNAVWESAKTIINEFNTFFRGLFSRLGTFAGAVGQVLYDAIVNTLKDMGIDVAPVLEGIRKAFEDVWAKVQGYIQPVIDLIATITTKIGEFKDYLGGLDLPNPFAGLASAGQAVMDAIGGIGNAASGGGTDGDPATPQAVGTSFFRGGAAQINERGYEQIVLPAGSRIYTNGQTNNLPTGEGKVFNINLGGVTVRSEADARRLGDMLRDQLVMAGA